MRELESTFAIAATTLGAIAATHGLLSGNTNATIIGMGCVLAGVFSSEMISLKNLIRSIEAPKKTKKTEKKK